MVSVGSGLLGAVLLITSTILYTLSALLKGSMGGGLVFTLIQFTSLRHPLASYGIPGISLLIIVRDICNYSNGFILQK